MKAVYFEDHGGPEVLRHGDFPDPLPAAGWVQVRVRACSLNYLDIFSRRGMPGITIPLPSITGGDAAGEISALGAGVQRWAVGQRVVIDPVYDDPESGRFLMLGENCHGALAELCTVHESQLIPLPDEVGFVQAACLPVAYGTAHRMLIDRGNVQADEKVLVLGASGGVGNACVLLSKARGAYVVGAASGPEKCRRLLELGADEVIDYESQDLVSETRRRTGGGLFSGGGYEVVINFTGGETWAPSLRCAKLGGRVLTCGATAGFDPPTDLRYIWTGELDVRGSNGWLRGDLEALLELVRTGSLKPVIDSVVDLAGAIDACRRLEDRAFFGKLVVTP
jgi:alcohol dehydrogenase